MERDKLQKIIELSRMNDLLPAATTEPEDIKSIMQALSDNGIHVVGEDQS